MTAAAWGALAIVYVVWGSTYLGIRIAIESIPTLMSGGMRFLVASALLAGFVAVRHGRGALRVSARRLGSAALVGVLLLAGGNGMVAVSEEHLATGLAALLVASVPLWLVLFRIGTGDRPPLATLAGVIAGFAGVGLLSLLGHGGSGSTASVVIILFGSLCWALGSFVSGRLPLPANSLTTSVYEMVAGGIAMLLLGLAHGERLHPSQVTTRSWLALAYLVAFGSLAAFTAYSWLLGNAPISLVGTYAYVNPAVAVALGALFLNEPVTWTVLAGGAIIIAGVGLVVSTERRPRTPRKDPEPALAQR